MKLYVLNIYKITARNFVILIYLIRAPGFGAIELEHFYIPPGRDNRSIIHRQNTTVTVTLIKLDITI